MVQTCLLTQTAECATEPLTENSRLRIKPYLRTNPRSSKRGHQNAYHKMTVKIPTNSENPSMKEIEVYTSTCGDMRPATGPDGETHDNSPLFYSKSTLSEDHHNAFAFNLNQQPSLDHLPRLVDLLQIPAGVMEILWRQLRCRLVLLVPQGYP